MPTELPEVARRKLRLALRAAREAKGITQRQVADALQWSPSKIQRIENGEVTVSRNDLVATLDLLGEADQHQIAQMVELARASRGRGWWDEPRFRQHVSDPMTKLVQFEAAATAIHVYHPVLIPGLLQTPDYADCILDHLCRHTGQALAVGRDLLTRRQAYVFDRHDPPPCRVAVDESVLLREFGGPEVMAEQLRRLLSLAERSAVRLRVLSFGNTATLAALGHFELVDLDEKDAIVYCDVGLAERIEQDPSHVSGYGQCFERVWTAALTEAETAVLIEAKLAMLTFRKDRNRRDSDE